MSHVRAPSNTLSAGGGGRGNKLLGRLRAGEVATAIMGHKFPRVPREKGTYGERL